MRAVLTDVVLRFEGAEAVEPSLLRIETVSIERGLGVVVGRGQHQCGGWHTGLRRAMGSAVRLDWNWCGRPVPGGWNSLDLGAEAESWWAAVVEVMGQHRWVPRRQVEQLER